MASIVSCIINSDYKQIRDIKDHQQIRLASPIKLTPMKFVGSFNRLENLDLKDLDQYDPYSSDELHW
jgi:hypothetical protein